MNRSVIAWMGAIVLTAIAVSRTCPAGAESVRQVPVIGTQQIEADWLRQDEVRGATAAGRPADQVKPEQDAVGALDGIINGKWGFHTADEGNPWWQVDLGRRTALERIELYNRCDIADRAARIMLLLSDDGKSFRQVYQHDGTVFYGFTDKKPLVVALHGQEGRYLRLQLPGKSYFHLDEVEIYAVGDRQNIGRGKPATQSSVSEWSQRHVVVPADAKPARIYTTARVIERGLKLAEKLRSMKVDVDREADKLRQAAQRLRQLPADAPAAVRRRLYLEARWAVRRMTLANPLLDFDTVLFVKRAPGILPHMSDQFYGWFSRPGGGICLLESFKTDCPRVRCLTDDMPPGSFLSPDLSYDGKRLLFAYCRWYPQVAAMAKVEKEKLPEDCFYHVFEMSVDGSGRRQITRGRYDDFDAHYLPSGEIVFLSTRKGTSIQCTKASAEATLAGPALPDSYVRCGGDAHRPVAVFTLHVMDAEGKRLRPISAFENFEWTPSVAEDGRILYARWDYIDRFNGPYISLWSTNPDGTNAQLVYGNYTARPQAKFEARSIPGSRRLIFTASAHHSINGGSLVLLDRARGTEAERPITRLTPEVPFPETEGNVDSYYENPYPLSEEFYLVAWSDRPLPPHCIVNDPRNPPDALGLYLYDAFGNLEPLYRDPAISSQYPLPVKPRPKPPALPSLAQWDGPQQGRYLLQDVYRGLPGIPRGSVKRLRIVGVPPKVQPNMNSPTIGVTSEDPGKFVLGTVPVEADGSAYFRVPSGVPVFFQALDAAGLAVQTMRSLTYVQPDETQSCIGCHEHRDEAPAVRRSPLAALRDPSPITPGPEGSWPLRFDRLVGKVLQKDCVSCHAGGSGNQRAACFDLTPPNAYRNLLGYAGDDLKKLVSERPHSTPGDCPASRSKLLALLRQPGGHEGVRLDVQSLDRLATWMDVYAQSQGSFSAAQETELEQLRRLWAGTLLEK
jgi:hypothetical protein